MAGVLGLREEKGLIMTSNSKKTKSKRNHKSKPNKGNLKEDMKRINKNRDLLRELAEKDTNS